MLRTPKVTKHGNQAWFGKPSSVSAPKPRNTHTQAFSLSAFPWPQKRPTSSLHPRLLSVVCFRDLRLTRPHWLSANYHQMFIYRLSKWTKRRPIYSDHDLLETSGYSDLEWKGLTRLQGSKVRTCWFLSVYVFTPTRYVGKKYDQTCLSHSHNSISNAPSSLVDLHKVVVCWFLVCLEKGFLIRDINWRTSHWTL